MLMLPTPDFAAAATLRLMPCHAAVIFALIIYRHAMPFADA